MILNQAGLPYYSQSFHYESTEDCKNFGGRMVEREDDINFKNRSESSDFLMGSYLSAMELYASSVLQSHLNFFDLNFSNFRIDGITRNNLYFIGIYEKTQDLEKETNYHFLQQLSDKFFENFEISGNELVIEPHQFDTFTQIILDNFPTIQATNCRNCLESCSDTHKGCIPHDFYYNRVNLSKKDDQVILETI